MYEHLRQPLASKHTFYRRTLTNIMLAFFILGICLLIGIVGYRYCCGMNWIDALHNASMILSGMGLVDKVDSTGGKLFSSAYALFSGVVFITNIGVILAPAMHRIMHRMHMQDK